MNDRSFRFVSNFVRGANGVTVLSKYSVRSDDPELRGHVAAYLESGQIIEMTVSPSSPDKLDDSGEPPLIRVGTATDGEWIWTYEMSYYARRHGVLPPREFLEKMESFGYTAPEVTTERLRAVSQWLDSAGKSS